MGCVARFSERSASLMRLWGAPLDARRPEQRGVQSAEEQYHRCRKAGHRYFGLSCRRGPLAQSGSQHNLLGACAPQNCSRHSLKRWVLPLVWSSADPQIFPNLQEVLDYKTRCQSYSMVELSHWREADLDFALIGYPKCGTSFAAQYLSRHAELVSRGSTGRPFYINNPGLREDAFFEMAEHRRLPERSAMDCYNLHTRYFTAQNRTTTGQLCRPFPRAKRSQLRFSYRAVSVFSRNVLHALSQLPNLRAIVLVREPLGFLDSLYNQFARTWVKGWNNDYVQRMGGAYGRLVPVTFRELVTSGSTFDGFSWMVRGPFRELGKFCDHIRQEVAPCLKHRLLVVKLEDLAQEPRFHLNSILRFAGASGQFGIRSVFQPANVNPKETWCDFCVDLANDGSLADVRSALQAYYSADVTCLEHLPWLQHMTSRAAESLRHSAEALASCADWLQFRPAETPAPPWKPPGLVAAARLGHKAAAEHLLAGGALGNQVVWDWGDGYALMLPDPAVEQCDDTGSTPLMAAAEEGHAEMVTFLLQSGSNPQRAVMGMTPLHLAADRGHTAIVKLLLAARCSSAEKANWEGLSPIDIASQRGQINVLVLLYRSVGFELASVTPA